jgi:serine O-acetyltransferase
MFELIKAYKKMDPAARNSLEIILLFPGVKALFFHRIAHGLYQLRIPFFPRLISELSRWITGIEIHPGAVIGKSLVIDHGMGVVIGETAEVGDNVLIYHGVTLGATHYVVGKRHPTIKSGTIIGAGTKILGNIVIGENVRVGANSVVLKSVPTNVSIAGAPAQIISKGTKQYEEWDFDYHI